ncbi:MAG TPA: ABC transporter permease [Acidimicrobiia bacterium]
MTATLEREAVVELKNRSTPEERRSTLVGVVLTALGMFVIFAFALGVDGELDATFNMSLQNDRFQDLAWVVNARTLSMVLGLITIGLGAWRLSRRALDWTNIALAVGFTLFSLAFLAWAAAGSQFSMVGMLRSTVILSVVVVFGALTGLMCERVGVINIGIEGQLLASAFAGVVLSSAFGTAAGILGALLTGGLLGLLLAWLTVRFHVDQIIAGVVINFLALGLTSLMSARILSDVQTLNAPARIPAIRIPILAEIPVIGPMLFDHTYFVYGMFILVVAIHLGLFYTRWGLRSRSVGEHPKAADTAGINVYWVRYRNVVLGGMIAGFGGAFLGLAQVARFEEDMTGGIGFIGLAAMIFGRWLPFGALGAGLVFGFARAVQQKAAILNIGLPSEFLLMLPYVVTIIVVAGVVGRSRPPAADGQPYIKQ